MKRQLIVLLIAAGTAGCTYGMTAEKFRHTSSARGVSARVTTTNAVFHGELLHVDDAGLLILTSSGCERRFLLWRSLPCAQEQERVLRLVPFSAIRSTEFEQLDRSYNISGGRAPRPAPRERLRLVSRFPHGLSPELLEQLLASVGQKTVAGMQR